MDHAADVTLTLRGERVSLRNAVSSVYNRDHQELLVATPTALYLYGKMLTAGGELLTTLAAEENAHYQFALHLPWLDAYSVAVTTSTGQVEHRIVSSDLKTSLTSNTLVDKGGQFYTALANPHRRELITADTDGGIKVWALRVIATAQNTGGFKGVLRVHTAANSHFDLMRYSSEQAKKPYYRYLRMSFDGQKIFAATNTKVYVFDAASCHRLPCCLREDRRTIFSMECDSNGNSIYLVFRTNMRKVCKYTFIVKKGLPQFQKVGEYEHDQEIAAFIENYQHPVNSIGTGNEVVMIDICANSMIIPGLGVQEKVSVVALVDDEDESILLLDYEPGNRRSRQRLSRKEEEEEIHESSKPSYEIPFLQWEKMSEHDRRVELMAACKSKCIQEDAEREEVFVPPVGDFESVEISVQLGVRSFTRWFAATQRHHQRIRERFLTEELTFAAIDPIVHQKLADVGLTTRHQTIPPEVLQRERLKSRTEYLEQRLRMVAQCELEVQEEEERAGPCEEECEPPQQVFIFEHFVKRLLGDKDSPTSWENSSLETQQNEIMLALMDPAVQIAAMRNDIELPDVSGSCMEDFDILALAAKFVPWWTASRNIHRRDFLKREAHEASTNKAILEILSKEQHSENGENNGVIKDFFESYFRSETARHIFLKKRLFYLRRKSRIASVARYGKLPAPLVMETLPLPLVDAFNFVERENVEMTGAEELIEVEDQAVLEEPEAVIEEQSNVDSIDNQREQEEELRRLEDEKTKITLELSYMTQEDALSREYNDSCVESDEEIDEPSLVLPKRTDFSRSYFFGNLPAHYRKVASSGWRAGSGVDNGDEEFEEEEQLERERERQRLLEEQEAERLLELERQVERARIEKEREEKAFQFRRVRQAELRKVLQYQAELEAQRKADLEVARERAERSQMQRDDEHSCWYRDQLLRDQNGMRLEDQLAFQIRKELREAASARVRQLLHEQACMSAEDQRSSLVAEELQELERDRTQQLHPKLSFLKYNGNWSKSSYDEHQ
ncbi:hypothetical protein JG687_00009280 [Phytophthora cactorum]|uniref:WD40-repeat-containing domain n=1 Tax=Phytophthora cactorum TaxID=29920 RepID=A0A8T1UF28_9STRA|nr:hypothetical protein JG687_00009280 [Phytophthora cactorum]